MNNVKTQIHDFAVKEEEKAKAWLGTNWVPFGLGAAAGALVMWTIEAVIHHL